MLRNSHSRILDCRPDNDITSIRTRNGAADQNDFFSLAHLHDLKILHGHTLIAEMARHALVFPNPSWRGPIADCADAPVRFRTVRRALPMKVVLLHHTLKSFTFRSANHIDIVARLKLRNAQIDLAFGKIVAQAKLAHEFLRSYACLLEFAKQRFGHARFLLCSEADLHGGIALVFFGQTTQQNVIAGSDHGHGAQSTLGVVNAGHTNFLSKKSDDHDRAIANVSEAPLLKS